MNAITQALKNIGISKGADIYSVSSSSSKKEGKKEGVLPSLDLPDLGSVEVSLTEESVKERLQLTAERRKWAEEAGKKLHKMKRSLNILYKEVQDWEYDPDLSVKEAQMRAAIEQIEGIGDQALLGLVHFSELICQIRDVRTEKDMDVVIGRLTKEITISGEPRYRKLTTQEAHEYKSENKGKLPAGAFYWKERVYFPTCEVFTKGMEALFNEISKKIRWLSHQRKEKIVSKSKKLKARRDVSDKLNHAVLGMEGLYRIVLEPKMEGKRVLRHGGVLVFRVFKKEHEGREVALVAVEDFSGCFGFFGEKAPWWNISVKNAVWGKIPEKFPEKHKDHAKRLASLMNEALFPVYLEIKGKG